MAKKQNKKGAKLDKGESLYSPEIAHQVKAAIFDFELVTSKGELLVTKLAKLLGIPARTFRSWRDLNSDRYKADLATAVKKAHKEYVEQMDAGKIKQGQIKKALNNVQVKKIYEKEVRGPVIPSLSGMDKDGLTMVAKSLKLKVKKNMSKGVLKCLIVAEKEKQTKETMILQRRETTHFGGDTNAAKFVLPHIGPETERWIPKEKLELEGLSLADIAAIMSGKGK